MAKIHNLSLQRATRETQAEKGCYQQEHIRQFRGRGKAKSFEIRLTFETTLPTISQMNFNFLLYNTINFMS